MTNQEIDKELMLIVNDLTLTRRKISGNTDTYKDLIKLANSIHALRFKINPRKEEEHVEFNPCMSWCRCGWKDPNGTKRSGCPDCHSSFVD